MMTIPRRFPGLLALSLGAAVLALGSRPARAIDFGFFGGFQYVPSPTDAINNLDQVRAARGPQPRTSNRPYADSPNAYFNNIRDNGFVPRSDITRRPSPASQLAPVPAVAGVNAAPTRPAPAAAPPPARPVVPLESFFDASLRVVWPSDSPTEGDLRTRRDVSDKASLATLEESRRYGGASISTVTAARQYLLDYGRPALRQMRAQMTPRIVDTFHLFLLSLYESLAQAATSPDAIADRVLER